MATGGNTSALKEFFLALGLDADAAAFAAAESMVHALEFALHKALEVAEKLADAFVETIASTIEWGDELQNASERLGIATTELQQLDFAARIANVSSEEMQLGMQHLARSMAGARDGSTELQQAFGKLHVRVTDGHGKLRATDEVLGDLAEGFKRLPPGAERTAMAMDLFGRSGGRLVPLLARGRAGIAELRQEAEELGLVLDEAFVERAAEADESMKRLHAVASTLEHEFAGPFIEALNPVLKTMLAWVRANRELISVKVHEWAVKLLDVIQRLASWLLKIADVVGFLIENWKALVVAIVSVTAAIALNALAVEGAAFAYFQMGVAAVAAAVRAAAAWLAAVAPIALIAAGIALLILAVEDFYTFLKGGDSVIGHVVRQWLKHFTFFFNTLDSLMPPWLKKLIQGVVGNQLDQVFGGLGFGKINVPAPAREAMRSALQSVPGGNLIFDRIFAGGGSDVQRTTNTLKRVEVPMNVQLNVTPHPHQNPKEIADETVKKLHDFHDARMREAFNAAQGG